MKMFVLGCVLSAALACPAWGAGETDADKLADAPPVKSQARKGKPAAGGAAEADVAPAEDDHYVQRDDYFIAEQPLNREEYIYISLAKMVTKPSKGTKGEAEFFRITDGNKVWSRHFWKTRIARKNELVLGTVVAIFEGNAQNEIYRVPEGKENARSGNWFLARVTDTSDLYKGYVTVSGGYKVAPDNLRIIMK